MDSKKKKKVKSPELYALFTLNLLPSLIRTDRQFIISSQFASSKARNVCCIKFLFTNLIEHLV